MWSCFEKSISVLFTIICDIEFLPVALPIQLRRWSKQIE